MHRDTSLGSAVVLVVHDGSLLPVVRRRRGRENLRRRVHSTVPQTDTGGRVEDTKPFEITIVKELGKMAP